MAEDTEEVRLTLRLPVGLRNKIAYISKESGRSLNAEIVHRLETSISFEDEYGSLKDVMTEVWKDIEALQRQVEDLSSGYNRRIPWDEN